MRLLTEEERRRTAALTAEGSTDAADDARRRARVERTRPEALAQGAAIAETLAREGEAIGRVAAMLRARAPKRAVIAGCGDSWFAGMAARPALEATLGIPVEPVQALDWAAWASATADRDTLLIGITSSGATPAVIAALDAARARGAMTLGVSNIAASPALSCYDAGLMVHATRRGWPTQASTAAVATLVALGAAAAHDESLTADLAALPTVLDRIAAAFDPLAAELAEALAPASLVLFSGGGPHYATACFGAAKVRELAPIHAFAMPLEEVHHYRFPKRGDPLFLVAPDGASRARAIDTALVARAVGARLVALVTEGDDGAAAHALEVWALPRMPAMLAPIAFAVPLHLFAWHFAMARFARGLGYPEVLA
jgi:glucosamine--fructose-6-phosphate aminotransferase (isomerizing)